MTAPAHGVSSGAAGSSAPPLRVLLLLDSLSNNGAVHITVDLARRWAPDGTVLAVLQQAGDDTGSLQPPPDVRLVQLSGRQRLRRSALPSLARTIRLARSADVVVGGSEIGYALLLGRLAARVAGRPFVVAVHADLDQALQEWMPRRLHPLFRRVHRSVAGAVCVDAALGEPLVRNGLAPDRIRVVTNGVDVDAIASAARGPGNLVRDDERVVVATGRLAPQKGYDVLLRAHALVRTPHRLLILNDGAERAALQALAAELGVSSTVEFAGAVANPLASVARATVFCLPSRHEGLPLALLEALALGVPVIASDSSEGVRAALDGGRAGDLVPVEDVAALARALEQHLHDPARLRELAAHGPAVAASFSGQAMVRGWRAALSDLADAHRQRSSGPRRASAAPSA